MSLVISAGAGVVESLRSKLLEGVQADDLIVIAVEVYHAVDDSVQLKGQ